MTGNSSSLRESRPAARTALTVGLVVAANAIIVPAAIVVAQRMQVTSTIAVSILALIVYFETFIAIVWYTLETRRMQRAVARQAEELAIQTRLSILPAFVMEFGLKPFDTGDIGPDLNEYYVHNLGRGIALNVTVERRTYVEDSYPDATIAFERVLVIQPGEKRKLPYNESLGQPTVGDPPLDLMTRLENEADGFREYEYLIEFDDLLGNHYSQVLYMTSRGCLPGKVKHKSSTSPK